MGSNFAEKMAAISAKFNPGKNFKGKDYQKISQYRLKLVKTTQDIEIRKINNPEKYINPIQGGDEQICPPS